MKNEKISAWLQGDQDYKQGLALYYEFGPNPRRIFPGEPTCDRCLNMLRLELEGLLDKPSAEPDLISLTSDYQEAGAISALKEELMNANLDQMPYAALKSLFMRLDLRAVSTKKGDILPVLKDEQQKLI